jgi:hypothetical protein
MGLLLMILIIVLGVDLLMAWLLQTILLAFGFSIGYWLCLGILFLVSVIFNSKGGK